MNAPVFAALAPGVLVVGRIVSATSSRNATSSGVNGAAGDRRVCAARSLLLAGGEQRAPADERDAAEQRGHPRSTASRR